MEVHGGLSGNPHEVATRTTPAAGQEQGVSPPPDVIEATRRRVASETRVYTWELWARRYRLSSTQWHSPSHVQRMTFAPVALMAIHHLPIALPFPFPAFEL